MPKTYTIPAKPKDDAGHLELIARIIFVIGFNYKVVEARWPLIKKAFKDFKPATVAKLDVEKVVKAEGMIRNTGKIERIIKNAQVCVILIKEHGSMKKWVQQVVKQHKKDPIFSQSLAEKSQELFAGIGKTTREWIAYVFAEGKAKPETRTVE